MRVMETNSTENTEINLYDDLLKFNELSPEERLAAIHNSVVEMNPDEQQTVAEIAEPFKEAVSEPADFNFVMSDRVQSADSVETPESNDMIFVLSEPETQATDNSVSNAAGELFLSYQDAPASVRPQATPSSDFVEKPQTAQPAIVEEQPAPVPALEQPVAPVASTFIEKTPQDFFNVNKPVTQPPAIVQEESHNFFTLDETPAPAENVVEETRTPAARTTDKQGVRITVREETAGSVTLSVADILGEDDFDDEPTESAEQIDKQPEPLPAVAPQQFEPVAAQPETIYSESEPPSASEPLKITDFLFTTINDIDAGEETSAITETPVTQPLDSLTEAAPASEEIITGTDFSQITASLGQSVQDSGKLEELLKVSRPLKITGFLNDPYKSDDASDDESDYVGEPVDIICSECGHISRASDLLCLECGAFFDGHEEETQSQLVCVDCGENVAADEVFCPACGSILLAH
jgi:hypothetical protein